MIVPNSVQKLRIDKMSECDYFGGDRSASDDTVVIAAYPGCRESFSFAYIVTCDDNSCWHQQAALAPSDHVVFFN